MPKAFKGVLRILTASLLNHEVVILLAMFYVTNGDGSTRLHDRAAEQALIISTVRYHLQSHRDGTSAFSPAAQAKSMGPNGVGDLTYIVTFEGSPPNAEMYFCTHLNARRSWIYMNEWFLPAEYYRLTILKAKVAYFPFSGFFTR
jgi:hypothetical protein